MKTNDQDSWEEALHGISQSPTFAYLEAEVSESENCSDKLTGRANQWTVVVLPERHETGYVDPPGHLTSQ